MPALPLRFGRASILLILLAASSALRGAASAQDAPLPTSSSPSIPAPDPSPVPASGRTESSAAPVSAPQVADAAQREQIRKQQEIFQVGPAMASADKLYKAGEYAKAQQYYLAILNTVTPAPATQAVYNQAVSGLMRCNAYLYEQARKKGDLAAMEAILTQSLTYAPDDAKLKAELARVQSSRRNPNDTALYASPAVNDDFKKKVETVASLLAQAEQAPPHRPIRPGGGQAQDRPQHRLLEQRRRGAAQEDPGRKAPGRRGGPGSRPATSTSRRSPPSGAPCPARRTSTPSRRRTPRR